MWSWIVPLAVALLKELPGIIKYIKEHKESPKQGISDVVIGVRGVIGEPTELKKV